MKKLFLLSLALIIALGFTSCGKKDKGNDDSSNTNDSPYVEDLSTLPASEGLEFELNEDGASYAYRGMFLCQRKHKKLRLRLTQTPSPHSQAK